jgi:hypothetical protein
MLGRKNFANALAASLALAALTGCASIVREPSSTGTSTPASTSPTNPSSSNSSSAQPTVEGLLTSEQRQVVENLLTDLPQPNALDSLDFERPTDAQLADGLPGADPNGLYINALTGVTDRIDEARAEWESQIVISAVWKTFADRGIGQISGGGLQTPNIQESDAQSAETWFTAASDPIRYTNSQGDSSTLDIAPDTVRSAIMETAKASGATVANLSFGSVIGTDAIAELSVPDPESWADALSGEPLYGSIDERNLEGIMFVVRDGNGDLIKCTTFATGYELGSVVYGSQYDRPPFAINAAPPTSPVSSSTG